LMPRLPYAPPELKGPRLIEKVDELIDKEAAADVALRVRECFGTLDGPPEGST
jgi:hypothetical protein